MLLYQNLGTVSVTQLETIHHITMIFIIISTALTSDQSDLNVSLSRALLSEFIPYFKML